MSGTIQSTEDRPIFLDGDHKPDRVVTIIRGRAIPYSVVRLLAEEENRKRGYDPSIVLSKVHGISGKHR